MGKLRARLDQVKGWDRLVLQGRISEGTEAALMSYLKDTGVNVLLNMSQITSVNSCGIAEWMTFIERLCMNRYVYLEQCPSDIVLTINMAPAFKGSAKVYSVYRNYQCNRCDVTESMLFTFGQNMPKPEELEKDGFATPSVACKKCQEDMDPEVLDEEFFAFLLIEE